MVGFRAQQQTLITGDIINNTLYGPDFDPDWDDTPLEDAKPIVTNLPSTFTWNNPSGSFSAGRLDYMFYTGSVMQLKNAYSLWSPSLSNEELSSSGLLKSDVEIASDHLPLIGDFFVEGVSNVSETIAAEIPIKFTLIGDELTVFFDKNISDKKIMLVDIMGRIIAQHSVNPFEDKKVIPLGNSGQHSIFILSISDENGTRSTRFFR